MTDAEFLGWVEQAFAGEACVYHVGLLAADRALSVKGGYLVNQTATLATKLATSGVARLTQRRVAEGHYEYGIVILAKRTAA